MVARILRRIAYGDPRLVTERDIDEYWSPTRLPGFAHAAHATLVELDWTPVPDSAAAAFAVPSLVLLGDDDHLIHTPRATALRLRGARVESVPGGHCAHEEHPELVYEMVGAFIR
jgi:pimeloyl-ACP methyl ester carboxylesterase